MIILALALTVVMLFLVYFLNKNNRGAHYTTSTAKKEKSNQITIYKFDGNRPVVVCRICDVENQVNAECCIVCGERLI